MTVQWQYYSSKKGEWREGEGSPFKIQCANAAAAAVTREMRSGEQGVITMRGMVGLKEGSVVTLGTL